MIYAGLWECWGCMAGGNYVRMEAFIQDPRGNRMVQELRRPVEDFRSFIRRENRPLQKIQMFFKDMDRRREELEHLSRIFPDMAVSSSISNNIEINDKLATKGEALGFLCRHLGIGIEETMSFGDGSNDLSMIQAAGIGVAMANAEESLKAAADYVTVSNDEDGVAKAIEKFCFQA